MGVDVDQPVRPLRPEDALVAVETLAAAFHADPLFGFMLPEPVERRRFIRVVMSMNLAQSGPDGFVYTPAGGATHGAMFVTPPGAWPTPRARLLAHLFAPSRPPLPVPSAPFLRCALGCLSMMERLHPTDPHWYLHVLGVHPDRAGQGHGGALLRELLRLAGSDGRPCWLETAKESNLGFYRRFGFELVHTLPTPRGGPPMWTMRRPGTV